MSESFQEKLTKHEASQAPTKANYFLLIGFGIVMVFKYAIIMLVSKDWLTQIKPLDPISLQELIVYALFWNLIEFFILFALRSIQKAKPTLDKGRVIQGFIMSWIVNMILFLVLPFALNAFFDQGVTKAHQVVLQSRQQRDHKGQTFYTLVVTTWRSGHTVETFDVSSATYRSAVVGKKILVFTKPGFLGMEWVSNVKLQ